MRRIFQGLLLVLFGTCHLASAAAISVAGADCGTDQLLGLTFTVPTAGTAACPDVAIGGIVGTDGSPLYGLAITSVEFTISDLSQLDGLFVLEGSALGTGEGGLTFTPTGFILSGSPGIVIGCVIVADGGGISCSPKDAVITLRGFTSGTQFTVTGVNGITVPEPATMTLLLMGAGAAAFRRRRIRAKGPI
ncbi:MAG TPA: PEP-CTERM sorting domain-containing protein [Vicinamibacterales bacterium]|nr:PEP-CTERM sorting domain-containing protein [Vicinamibacterales bacterium]